MACLALITGLARDIVFNPKCEFPEDCLELVHSRDSFVFPGWERRIGPVPLFRVSGITDVLKSVSQNSQTDLSWLDDRKFIQHLIIIAESVVSRIPPTWKDYFSPPGNAWTPLGEPQIKLLQHSGPQTFDRALMSIIFVAEFIERVLHEPVPEDFFNRIRIVPAVYYFRLPDNFWQDKVETNKALQAMLVKALGHRDNMIIAQALKEGRRMTWRTASMLQKLLSDHGFDLDILCSGEKRPKAVDVEPLVLSRQMEHEPVTKFMIGPNR